MKTPKQLRTYTIITSIIVIVLLGAYYVVYVKNAFGTFNRSIEAKIESWAQYKPTDKTLGQGICDDKQFGTTLEMINSQPRTALQLDGGLTLIATENPLRWRNSEFRDYFVLSECRTTGGYVPVRAYRDTLLWKNECSGFFEKSIASPCTDIQESIAKWEESNATSSNEQFNEAGIRFQSPPGYHHALLNNPISGYYRFIFYPDGTTGGSASISLFIPLSSQLNLTDIEQEFSYDLTLPDTITPAKVILDGREGLTTTVGEHPIGDTMETYPVTYSNTPIVMSYNGDDSMLPYWKMMHDTWQFDE